MSPSSDFIRKSKKVIPFKRNDDGNYIVLYACVCLIDEYDTEQGRSFEQIREKARQLERPDPTEHTRFTARGRGLLPVSSPIFVQKTLSQEAHLWEGQKADKVLRQARSAEL